MKNRKDVFVNLIFLAAMVVTFLVCEGVMEFCISFAESKGLLKEDFTLSYLKFLKFICFYFFIIELHEISLKK